MLPIKACVKTLGSLCARLLAFWGSTSLPGGNSSDSRDQARSFILVWILLAMYCRMAGRDSVAVGHS